MLIKITVEIPDEPFQGLLAAVWSLVSGGAAPGKTVQATPVPAPVETPAETPPAKRTRKAKEEPREEAVEASEAFREACAPEEPSETPAEVAPTVEDVLKRAADFMKEVKDGAAIVGKILKEMGFGKVREIPVAKLPEFLAKLAAA